MLLHFALLKLFSTIKRYGEESKSKGQARVGWALGSEYPKFVVLPAPEDTKQWAPGYEDFIAVFNEYGANLGHSENQKLLQAKPADLPFPTWNFKLIMNFLGLCVTFRY